MTPSDHPDAKRQLEGEAMTMREQIARAVCCPRGCGTVGEDLNCIASLTCAEAVDAVLAALAEPTEAMTIAGFHANICILSSAPRTTKSYYPPADNIGRVWQAMIEAA